MDGKDNENGKLAITLKFTEDAPLGMGLAWDGRHMIVTDVKEGSQVTQLCDKRGPPWPHKGWLAVRLNGVSLDGLEMHEVAKPLKQFSPFSGHLAIALSAVPAI